MLPNFSCPERTVPPALKWNIHYGGSNPLPPQGWQRNILLTAFTVPRKKPYFSMESFAYSEQLGLYRQEGGKSGERAFWYKRIKKTAASPNPLSKLHFFSTGRSSPGWVPRSCSLWLFLWPRWRSCSRAWNSSCSDGTIPEKPFSDDCEPLQSQLFCSPQSRSW